MKTNRLSTAILILVFLTGLSLLLYPTFSDYWNSFRQSRAISNYAQEVASLDEELYDSMLAEARAFNDAILTRPNPYTLTDEQTAAYDTLLNLDGHGVMGYIEIPSISCSVPIYHGTEESVLQKGIGHLAWSALPVGGESTHCVISGHRGLPSARLFTDLDRVNEGDVFYLRVLDELLTYEVDQILIVEPTDTEALLPAAGEDLCTLVTCTPYGINTHRLLVRGHRIENLADTSEVRVTADAVRVEPIIVAPLLAIPMILVFVLWVLLSGGKKQRHKR